MSKKQLCTTPIMIVRYAYLTAPSTTHKKQGEYVLKVAIKADSPEAAELQEGLKARYDVLSPPVLANLKPAQKAKVVRVPPWQTEEDPETGEETGYITMTFSLTASVARKSDGKLFYFKPELFDANNDALNDDQRKLLKIGAGTTVRVSYSADRCYAMEGTDAENKKFTKSGLSLDLAAVKLLDVVEYGASAGSYGFGDDEGSFNGSEVPEDVDGSDPGDGFDAEGKMGVPQYDGDF